MLSLTVPACKDKENMMCLFRKRTDEAELMMAIVAVWPLEHFDRLLCKSNCQNLRPPLLSNVADSMSGSPQICLTSCWFKFTKESLRVRRRLLNIQACISYRLGDNGKRARIVITCSRLDFPLPTVPMTPTKSPGPSLRLMPASMNCSLWVSSLLWRKDASLS